MKIVKCHLVVLKMWCNIIILHWNDSFCIDMFVLAVLNCQSSFYCKKDFQKPVCSIFGYNTRSMRNNRSIARGSNTSNIFCRDKTYLGVEVTTRMGIDWNIYLIINERCKTDQKLHINIFIFMINYQCYIGCRGYRLCHHNYNLETLMDWYLAPFLVYKAKS